MEISFILQFNWILFQFEANQREQAQSHYLFNRPLFVDKKFNSSLNVHSLGMFKKISSFIPMHKIFSCSLLDKCTSLMYIWQILFLTGHNSEMRWILGIKYVPVDSMCDVPRKSHKNGRSTFCINMLQCIEPTLIVRFSAWGHTLVLCIVKDTKHVLRIYTLCRLNTYIC